MKGYSVVGESTTLKFAKGSSSETNTSSVQDRTNYGLWVAVYNGTGERGLAWSHLVYSPACRSHQHCVRLQVSHSALIDS